MKKPTQTEVPNSIVLRIEDAIHVFLIDENEIVNIPSIPISDNENVYEWLKPTQISFSNTKFSTLDNKPANIEKHEDFQDLKYSIRDLFSITIFDKEGKETAAELVLKEGSLNNVIKQVLSGGEK